MGKSKHRKNHKQKLNSFKIRQKENRNIKLKELKRKIMAEIEKEKKEAEVNEPNTEV